MEIKPDELIITTENPYQIFADSLPNPATKHEYINVLKKVSCQYLKNILTGDKKLVEEQMHKPRPRKRYLGKIRTFADADFETRINEFVRRAKSEILDILHIRGTPFEKIILSKNTNFISARSIEQLQSIVNYLSQRKNLVPSQVCVPLYVISKISRLEEESHQLQLITQIKGDLEGMSDGSFAWTTPEQIDSMIKYIRQDATHEENNREESTVANVTKTSDVGKPKEKEKKSQSSSKPTNNKETETIKKSIRQVFYYL